MTGRDAILHLADLHLGASVSKSLAAWDPVRANKLLAERNRFLERLAEWISRDDCPVGLVLIAGDLFDSHSPPGEVVESALRGLARIVAVGLPVVTVPGNHDEFSYAKCIYRHLKEQNTWPGVLVTGPQPEVVWEGQLGNDVPVRIVSACYQAGCVPPGGVVELPPCPEKITSIALIHGSLNDPGLLPLRIVEGERCFRVSAEEASRRGYAYLALGHIHRFGRWNFGRLMAVYSGAPLGRSEDDPGTGHLTLIRPAKPSRTAMAPDLELSTVSPPEVIQTVWRVIREEVTIADTPERFVETLLARLERNTASPGAGYSDSIDVVKLHGQLPAETFVQECAALLEKKSLRVLFEWQQAEVVPPIDLQLLAREQSLAGQFIRQWEKWKDASQEDEAFAQAVLYEGLRAILGK